MTTHPRLRSKRSRLKRAAARAFTGVVIVVTALSAALLVCGARPAAAQGYGWFGNLFGGARPQPPQPPSYPGSGYPSYPRQGYARPGNSGQAYPGQSYSGRGYPGQTYPGQGYPSQGYAAPSQGRDYGSYDQPRRRPPRRRQVEQAQKEAPPRERAPPKNASLFVDVFGDSLGQMLGNGLDDAFSDRQDVAIIHKARASTGLVATDTFDWPKAIAEMLDAKNDAKGKGEAKADGKGDDKGDDKAKKLDDRKPDDKKPDDKKIDVAVMMIGTNDRQPIRENGATLALGTPDWASAYRKRVAAIDDAFRRHGVPLVWVGVPITKDDAFADDMAAFNDIYREEAAKSGATYVDTWEAFSDEDGDFSSYGPDVNGQTVRLRAPDGVHFTRAGERKLAHFVETHVRRDLDGKVPIPQLPTDGPPVAATPGGKPAVAALKPEAGPIKSLTDAPAASNGQLSSVAAYRDIANHDGVLQSALVRGEAASALAGRADDMRWSADPKAN